jgi:DNA-binding NtrC family response regulator
MLDHDMTVRSRLGQGSCFSVTVPLATPAAIENRVQELSAVGEKAPLQGLTVLCVDNEPDILEGMKMLLERWGCTPRLAANRAQSEQQVYQFGAPDFVLVDYHLAEQGNGLDVLMQLEKSLGKTLPAIVITADRSTTLEDEVRQRGYGLLRKPIKPAALRLLISNMLKDRE